MKMQFKGKFKRKLKAQNQRTEKSIVLIWKEVNEKGFHIQSINYLSTSTECLKVISLAISKKGDSSFYRNLKLSLPLEKTWR
jgi:hypothetical protein